jgi:DNA-binding NarL/FixJ family response regulator
MIRAVLVDDQTLVRSGIAGLLALTPDIRVVAEAADGVSCIDVIAQAAPDVVLLDVRMPGRSGVEVLRQLQEQDALPPTILLTTFDDDEVLFEGMRAGAKGFLLKDISLERLADGIRRVHGGGSLFRPALTERAIAGANKHLPDTHALLSPLSAREGEVLAMMAGGFNNREIGAALGCSEGTVKNHVSSILSKMGVRDRVRAVLQALTLGLL